MAGKLTAVDKKMYELFMSQFPFCMACGWKPGMYSKRWRKLENAHIVGGAGRRHDRRAIVRLCMVCHQLNHGASIVAEGWEVEVAGKRTLPTLSRENLLWLKQHYDIAFLDVEYLESLSVKAIGQPEELHPIYEQAKARWRS